MDGGALNWLRAFQVAVNAKNYNAGMALCDPSTIGFGTVVNVAKSRSFLVDQQWRKMWPHIIHFEFQTDSMVLWHEYDIGTVVIAILWKALNWKRRWFGRARYWRSGRATIVLRDGKAIHTHFSVTP